MIARSPRLGRHRISQSLVRRSQRGAMIMRTRRDFIHAMGRVGGYSAAYLAMQGMGLLPNFANAAHLDLEPGSGRGVKIVILGAGMAGLASADELLKAG